MTARQTACKGKCGRPGLRTIDAKHDGYCGFCCPECNKGKSPRDKQDGERRGS